MNSDEKPETHDGETSVNQTIEQKIIKLRSDREQIKAALLRFESFLNKFTEDKIANLELRLRNVESNLMRDFNEVQSQLEMFDKTELKQDERGSFEDLYFEVTGQAISTIRRFYDNKQPSQGHSQNTNQNFPSNSATNVSRSFPSIELVKFYGEYDKWTQFRDLFKTLVHDEQSIDKIRKFYYLLSSLKGDAAKILESIEITGDNYDIAWALLNERYENKELTIKNHIKALFELPTVSKDKFNLRNLVDEFQKRFRALKLLNEPVDSWSTILIYLLTSKLDFRTATQWEEFVISKKISKPDIHTLLDFLSDRCKLLETSDVQFKTDKKEISSNQNKGREQNKRYSYSTQIQRSFNLECIYCKEKHYIYHCQKFSDLSVQERMESVTKLKLCSNCLRANHSLDKCIAQGCKICSKKHNTLLHINNLSANETENSQTTGDRQKIVQSSIAVNHSVHQQNEVLLSTAIVLIKDCDQNWHECRALLDSGSQSNFITKDLAEKLKIPFSNIKIPVVGIGNACSTVSNQVNAKIKSYHNSYCKETNFLIIDKITENLPSVSFKKSVLNLPDHIKLADFNFNQSSTVDILLGVNIFYDILRPEKKQLGENLPILQDTAFGWVISGSIPMTCNSVRCNFARNSNIEPNIEQQLERFWTIEEYSVQKFYTDEELECEKMFVENLKRDTNGQFVVTLPIRENSGLLGESYESATKRLKSMERKFIKNPEFKNQYLNFMQEYEKLGHMKKIDTENINVENNGKNLFYLPHHGVLNDSSTTTALRVVFDGSCPSSTGVSLNDILMTGPTNQEDLFSILIRFRQHNIVITADVAKMYRQVKVVESQRDLQRIVWRLSPDEEISHYQLLTVTYGTAPASFLATRALQQTAVENRTQYPEACQIILKDFYVDDLITGKNTIQEVIQLKK